MADLMFSSAQNRSLSQGDIWNNGLPKCTVMELVKELWAAIKGCSEISFATW